MNQTGRAKLPKIQVPIASRRCVATYLVASCRETKIVASSPPGIPASREGTA